MKRMKNKEIAEKLGISTAAVSLAINNRPGVSEATRNKVLKLLGESKNIRPMNTVDGSTILLIIHKRHGKIIIDKPFFSDLIESIQTTALKNSYSLELSHYNASIDISEYVVSLMNMNISGAIILATEMLTEDLEHYKKLNVPIVLLDSAFDFEEYDSVTIENSVSMMKAVEYANSQGHKDIGYLRSSVFINNFQDRFDGFLCALHRFNIVDYNHPIIPLSCSMETAYTEMREFIRNKPIEFKMPTCFVSDLDYIAIGAMRALQEEGYRIPEDISIIGFDDVTACEICNPRLTTVRVNRKDIGAETVGVLINRINNPHEYYKKMQISSEFVIRDSVIKRS